MNEPVVVGANGFLFQSHDQAFEQLCEASTPTDRALSHWATLLEASLTWCAAKHARFVSLIIPERHVVYADRLPARFSVAPARAVNRLLAMMDPALRHAVLYPEDRLAAARDTGDVFLSTDEHLSLHGYYACYRALVDCLAPGIPVRPMPLDALPVKRFHVSGNLGMRLDSEPTEDLDRWLADAHTWRAFSKHGAEGRVEIFHNDDRSKPRALVYGDSNADAMRHVLTPLFSRTMIVYNCHQLFHELVRREQPDVVLHVMSELRLGRSPAEGAATIQVIDAFFEERKGPLPSRDTLLALDFDLCGQCEPLLGEGWSHCEETHTWMVDQVSTLRLPPETSRMLAAAQGRYRLELSLLPQLDAPPARRLQRLSISYGSDGDWIGLGRYELRGEARLHVFLPRHERAATDTVFLRFEHPDGFAPAEYGEVDQRVMSLALRHMCIVADRQ